MALYNNNFCCISCWALLLEDFPTTTVHEYFSYSLSTASCAATFPTIFPWIRGSDLMCSVSCHQPLVPLWHLVWDLGWVVWVVHFLSVRVQLELVDLLWWVRFWAWKDPLPQRWFLLKGLKWNTLFGHWNLQVAEQALHHLAQIPICFVLINQKSLLV